MALTATLVSQTPNRLRYLLEQDGEAGAAVTITAATLLADCISGPLKEMPGIGSNIAALDQAGARRQLLGQGAAPDTDLTNIQHAACEIMPRGPSTQFWAVDADVDAVNPLRGELNIVSGAASGEAILEVEFQHTLIR